MPARWSRSRLALAISLALGCGDPASSAPADAEHDAAPHDAAPPDAAPHDAAPPARWLDAPTGALPERMSELGLFPAAPRLDVAHPRAIEIAPRFALWSNGSRKVRHVVVPEGAHIDVRDPEAWRFPVGTLLFKTFAFSRGGAERAVETRVLVRRESRWEYAAYRWDDDGHDATRLPLEVETPIPITLDDGSSFAHEVPASVECAQCHRSPPGDDVDREVLGVRADMLGEAVDALEPVLEGAVEAVDPLAALEERDRWVAGYALGNCVHCHHGGGGTNGSFDLRPEVFAANTVGVPTTEASSPPGLRVAPGDPDASVLFQMLTRESPDDDVQPMPPVGVQRPDAEAIARFEMWIQGLAEEAR